MKRLLAALLFAASAHLAHGQILSVYGLFTPVHVSNVQTGSVYSSSSGYTNQFTSFTAPALGGGLTLNVLNLHVVKLGIDLRGSTRSGTTGADTAEVSLRLGFKPPLLNLKPYGQVGVGYLETRTSNVSTLSGSTTPIGGTFTNRYATAGFHAGVDIPVFPFVDLRLAEIGYARAFNTGLSGSNANVTSFATGIVVHF